MILSFAFLHFIFLNTMCFLFLNRVKAHVFNLFDVFNSTRSNAETAFLTWVSVVFIPVVKLILFTFIFGPVGIFTFITDICFSAITDSKIYSFFKKNFTVGVLFDNIYSSWIKILPRLRIVFSFCEKIMPKLKNLQTNVVNRGYKPQTIVQQIGLYESFVKHYIGIVWMIRTSSDKPHFIAARTILLTTAFHNLNVVELMSMLVENGLLAVTPEEIGLISQGNPEILDDSMKANGIIAGSAACMAAIFYSVTKQSPSTQFLKAIKDGTVWKTTKSLETLKTIYVEMQMMIKRHFVSQMPIYENVSPDVVIISPELVVMKLKFEFFSELDPLLLEASPKLKEEVRKLVTVLPQVVPFKRNPCLKVREYADTIVEYHRTVSKKVNNLCQLSDAPRQAPIMDVLCGDSGLGKTGVLAKYTSHYFLIEFLKLRPSSTYIYTKSKTSNFYEHYNANKHVYIEEELAPLVYSSIIKPEDYPYALLMDASGTARVPLDQAAVEGKGNVAFVSEYVSYTTNHSILPTDFCYSKEAVLRRLNYRRPVVKKAFRGVKKASKNKFVTVCGVNIPYAAFYWTLSESKVEKHLAKYEEPLEKAIQALDMYTYDVWGEDWYEFTGVRAFSTKVTSQEYCDFLFWSFTKKNARYQREYAEYLKIHDITEVDVTVTQKENEYDTMLDKFLPSIKEEEEESNLFTRAVNNMRTYTGYVEVKHVIGTTVLLAGICALYHMTKKTLMIKNCLYTGSMSDIDLLKVNARNCPCPMHSDLVTEPLSVVISRYESIANLFDQELIPQSNEVTPSKAKVKTLFNQASEQQFVENFDETSSLHSLDEYSSLIPDNDSMSQTRKSVIFRNSCILFLNVNSLKSMICTSPCSKYLLFPWHFIDLVTAKNEKCFYVMLLTNPGEYTRIDLENCKLHRFVLSNVEIDVVLIYCPQLKSSFRNIVSKFINVQQMHYLTDAYPIFMTADYALMKGKHVVHISTTKCDSRIRNVKSLFSVNAKTGIRYEIPMGLEYDIPTMSRSCGSLVFANHPRLHESICGIHTCGDSIIGVSNVVNAEMIRKGISTIESTNSLVTQSGGSELRVVCKLNYSHASNCKTQLRRSIIANYLMENTPLRTCKVPSLLRPTKKLLEGEGRVGELINPMYERIKKFLPVPENNNDSVLDMANFDLEKSCFDDISYSRTLLNEHEIVFGYDGLNAMAKTTALGFPETTYAQDPQKILKGKKYFVLHRNPDGTLNYPPGYELIAKEEKIIEQIFINDEYYALVCIVCLKDELLTLEKVNNVRSRVFFVSPLAYNKLVRKYFGKFMSWFTNTRIKNGSAIGVNVYSKEWKTIADRLRTFSEGGLCDLDFKEHETTAFTNTKLGMISDLINNWYRKGKGETDWCQEHDKIRTKLIWHMLNSYAIVPNDDVFGDSMDEPKIKEFLTRNARQTNGKSKVIKIEGGFTSGNGLTAILNTIMNMFNARIMYYGIIRVQLPTVYLDYPYQENVKEIVLGDDIVFHFSLFALKHLSPQNVVDYYHEMGMTATSGDKISKIRFDKKLNEVTFCSRTFDVESDSMIIPKLKYESIMGMIFWNRGGNGMNKLEACLLNCDTALFELHFYGCVHYNEIKDYIEQALKNRRAGRSMKSYEEQRMRRLMAYTGEKVIDIYLY